MSASFGGIWGLFLAWSFAISAFVNGKFRCLQSLEYRRFRSYQPNARGPNDSGGESSIESTVVFSPNPPTSRVLIKSYIAQVSGVGLPSRWGWRILVEQMHHTETGARTSAPKPQGRRG